MLYTYLMNQVHLFMSMHSENYYGYWGIWWIREIRLFIPLILHICLIRMRMDSIVYEQLPKMIKDIHLFLKQLMMPELLPKVSKIH